MTEAKKKTAINFLKMGLPVAEVATATELTLEEVDELKKDNDLDGGVNIFVYLCIGFFNQHT